jgi:serine/threonine protein kinase
VKAFKIPNFINQIVYAYFRESKAKKSYANALKLLNMDILTPQAIGYIEFYRCGLFKESFFIAKRVEYDFTIREPLLDKKFPNREEILKEFAIFTLSLHHKNIFHNDYSPGNILIKKDNESYKFYIVDINRMKFTPLSLEMKLQNFSKLWIDDEDLEFMIRQYAFFCKEDEKSLVSLALRISNQYKNAKEFKRNIKKRLFQK